MFTNTAACAALAVHHSIRQTQQPLRTRSSRDGQYGQIEFEM
jgi:hypothetical protein